jgi:hypothetical protein
VLRVKLGTILRIDNVFTSRESGIVLPSSWLREITEAEFFQSYFFAIDGSWYYWFMSGLILFAVILISD